MTEAFRKGELAAERQEPKCPYAHETVEWCDWFDGWYSVEKRDLARRLAKVNRFRPTVARYTQAESPENAA